MFEIVEKASGGTNIKVIGVGGAGGNAVDHMIREGVQGVDFIIANTDAQALSRCLAQTKVQLGKTGLGAGSKPEAGRAAAQESRDAIAAALSPEDRNAWKRARVEPAPARPPTTTSKAPMKRGTHRRLSRRRIGLATRARNMPSRIGSSRSCAAHRV